MGLLAIIGMIAVGVAAFICVVVVAGVVMVASAQLLEFVLEKIGL